MSISKTANWMKQNANINSPLKLRMGVITQCDGAGTASVYMLDSTTSVDVYTMPGVVVTVGSSCWLLQTDTSLILIGPVADTMKYLNLNVTNLNATNINAVPSLSGNSSITGGGSSSSTTYFYPTTGSITVPAQPVNGFVQMWGKAVCTKSVSTDQVILGITDGAGSPVSTYGVSRWYSDGQTVRHLYVHGYAATTAGVAFTAYIGVVRESGTGSITIGSGDSRFHTHSFIWTPSSLTY